MKQAINALALVLVFIALALALVLFGCEFRPYELERRGLLLKSGMTKTEVKALFADFPLRRETNMVGETQFQFETKQFSTNPTFSSLLLYFPKGFTDDSLSVIFDTNGVIVAYHYDLMK